MGLMAGDALLGRSLLAARACSLAFVPPNAMRYEPYAAGLSCVAQIEDPATLSGATVFETADGATLVACRGSAMSSARRRFFHLRTTV